MQHQQQAAEMQEEVRVAGSLQSAHPALPTCPLSHRIWNTRASRPRGRGPWAEGHIT